MIIIKTAENVTGKYKKITKKHKFSEITTVNF